MPIEIQFGQDKILAWSHGTAFDGIPIQGYEIHHGYVSKREFPLSPFITDSQGSSEGVQMGNIFGTHWHGIFESDDFRRAFLTKVASQAKRKGFRVASNTTYAKIRERMLDSLGDLIEQHVDTKKLWNLIEAGASGR